MYRHHRSGFSLTRVLILGLLAFWAGGGAFGADPLAIQSAVYNKKSGTLKVKAKVRDVDGTIVLIHGDGGVLAESALSGNKQVFIVPRTQLGQVPCSITARVGDHEASKKVAGAPKDCAKLPVCEILEPKDGAKVTPGTPMTFSGKARLKDKNAGPLTYLWDFSGGVFENSHPNTLSGQVSFVRDNSLYRVRFSATDQYKRRCEAVVEVQVGNPPDTGLAKVAEQPAPTRAAGLNPDQQVVVLPFQNETMQEFGDHKTSPTMILPSDRLHANIQAHVIKKGSVGQDKPRILSDLNQYRLKYSAASNPSDPVGHDSINSTSQNWPLNPDPTQAAPLASAMLQKTDVWESVTRPAELPRWEIYTSTGWMDWGGIIDGGLNPRAPVDEGVFPRLDPVSKETWIALNKSWYSAMLPGMSDPDLVAMLAYYYDYYLGYVTDTVIAGYAPINPDHARYMPGKSDPFKANQPQEFSPLVSSPDQPRTLFAANRIPVTDIDDRGRVNPYPLFRVQAEDWSTGKAVTTATTDTVVANSRDLHCRECHLKGEGGDHLGANTAVDYTRAMNWFKQDHSGEGAPYGPPGTLQKFYDRPEFYDAAFNGGDSNSLFDQEYAAALNIASLHQFYALGFYGSPSYIYSGGGYLDFLLEGTPAFGKAWRDGSFGCTTDCHHNAPTVLETQQYNARHSRVTPEHGDFTEPNNMYWPIFSMAIHRQHGSFQYNADRSDILRWDNPTDTVPTHTVGVYKRWDWFDAQHNPTPSNPNSLFPTKDAGGNSLPMEENCLRCHAGKREELYRDVHKSAGTTCYDCHGDMAAVGMAYPQDGVHKVDPSRDYREPWYDEPDCGSCHTGNGNVGGDGYYSAGVMKRAFDAGDPSATPRKPDLDDTDAKRFAVSETMLDPTVDIQETPTDTSIKVRLYRLGRDEHANLACGACHGGSHGLWPNPEAEANDNLTAIQLQGYEGPVEDCRVCHSQGAFDKGEVDKSLLKDGVLAGPHGLHPINEFSWYGGATDSNGNPVPGGWHAAFSKKPGPEGEDQCAACHGNDHRGTRLAKAAVDREYRNAQGKIWDRRAKGEIVGCDLCHSLEVSFKGTPTGGGGHSGNHAPVITSAPPTGLDAGVQFRYTVTAIDADNDTLSFGLTKAPDGMSIDPATGVVTWTTPADGGTFTFQATVSDGKGGIATQGAILTVCYPGSRWHAAMSMCM